MSEETNAFVADVYVNGKKVGYAKNDGHGGSTNVRSYPDTRDQFKKAEGYCKTLPDTVHKCEGMKPFTMKSDLESVVDELFETWLKQKEVKKLEKKMVNHLMWGIPGGTSYTQMKFVKPLNEIDREIIQKFIDKYKKDFKEGVVFLNTNLVGFDL
jgi:hypothetical protein